MWDAEKEGRKAKTGVRDERTYAIIGAAMEVHRQLGSGFLEAVYQDALEIELKSRGIPYEREKRMVIIYKGLQLQSFYLADFVCYATVVVELKALSNLSGTEESQVLNYLKASGLPYALLFNFGKPRLYYKRFANTRSGNPGTRNRRHLVSAASATSADPRVPCNTIG